ncbi:uncharacterized protein LOC131433609 [Malaya genurostris]|uniref:uncharacterized protein LOC131433609 n=1 Tax=Malaya genurostris TaxID=325434 RepID=UPI0026F3828B|nr:uncharacterized protein LOC131433609 [Malaya genurostris]
MKCIVPGCKTDFHKRSACSKHRLPSDATRRAAWIKAILDAHPGTEANFMLANTEHVRVCSLHFTPRCFSVSKNHPRLKIEAIPTIFRSMTPADPIVNRDRARVIPTSVKRAPIAKRYQLCAVLGCEQNIADFMGISTHGFPLEVQECKEWISFSKNRHAAEQFALHGSAGMRRWRMCSRHFEPSLFKYVLNQPRTLKPGSLPTLYPANPTKVTKRVKSVVGPVRDRDIPSDQAESSDEATRQLSKRPSSPTSESPSSSDNHSACNCPCCQNRRTEFHDKGDQTEDSGPLPDPFPLPLRYQDSCRLCFIKRDLQPLFSGLMVVREEMLQRIYACTGILIIPKRKESMFICVECGDMINAFYSFRQQTRSNNQALILRIERDLANANVLREKKKRKIVKPSPHPAMRNVKQQAPQPTQRIELIAKNILTSPVVTLEPNPLELPEEIKEEPMDSLELIDKTESCHFSETLKLEVSVDKVEYQPEWDIRKDPPEADDGKDSWNCWHCHQMYRFKFECAKHLLQEHREEVGTIRRRLQLDELNYNMLEMMSERLSKV